MKRRFSQQAFEFLPLVSREEKEEVDHDAFTKILSYNVCFEGKSRLTQT